MAHVGGFVAGFVLISLFKRREIPILEPAAHKPFQIERRTRAVGIRCFSLRWLSEPFCNTPWHFCRRRDM